MSLWYTRKEYGRRIGFFWSFSSLAGACGGLIAFGISQIQNDALATWQWYVKKIYITKFIALAHDCISFCIGFLLSKVFHLSSWRLSRLGIYQIAQNPLNSLPKKKENMP